jgi:hypothetical protein
LRPKAVPPRISRTRCENNSPNGLEDVRNGDLLAAAAVSFDVFITVDKNIKRQQNLAKLPISVIVLNAMKSTPDVIKPFAPYVDRVLKTIRIGQMLEINGQGEITIVAPGRARLNEER